jgi:hypothetical protein
MKIELLDEYIDAFTEERHNGNTDKTSFKAWLEDIVANGRIEQYKEEAKQILEWRAKYEASN